MQRAVKEYFPAGITGMSTIAGVETAVNVRVMQLLRRMKYDHAPSRISSSKGGEHRGLGNKRIGGTAPEDSGYDASSQDGFPLVGQSDCSSGGRHERDASIRALDVLAQRSSYPPVRQSLIFGVACHQLGHSARHS